MRGSAARRTSRISRLLLLLLRRGSGVVRERARAMATEMRIRIGWWLVGCDLGREGRSGAGASIRAGQGRAG